MNLCIDIGNSFVKLAVFNAEAVLLSSIRFPDVDIEQFATLINDYKVQQAILSSVRTDNKALIVLLRNYLKKVIVLSSEIAIPVSNSYKTPETLGNDRLAVVVAATVLFPQENVLIVDAGTCITYDFITENNEYLGGSILPGIDMRFKSMAEFTAKLPLADKEVLDSFVGNSTLTSLQTGVMHGVLHEIKGFKEQYQQQFGNIRLIVTGGDASYFESQLKNEIFAEPNLVLIGLNRILNYNTK
jgi:type III pantothenate kinase